MKGAKPKPTHLKMIAGNPGKRQLPEDEPIPEGDLIEPPDHLSESQKQIWREGIEACPKGLLKKLDLSIFMTWVISSDIHRKASIDVGTEGIYGQTLNGELIASIATKIIKEHAAIIIKSAAEMGFTPSSRSRVKLSDPKKKQNPFLVE